MKSEESPIDIHNCMTFIVFTLRRMWWREPFGKGRSKLSTTMETSPFFKLNRFLASKAGVEQTGRREIELDLAM